MAIMMAEIPTPHSLAIGTLIALFSDPNSALIHYSSDDDDSTFHDDDAVHRGRRQQEDGANANAGVRGRGGMTTDEWTLKLSKLIQQLVMKEDEGVVLLDDDDGAKGRSCAIGYGRRGLQEEEEEEEEEGKWNEREARDDDHDDFFKRHFEGLDDLDIDLDFNVLFNDTLDSIKKSRNMEGFSTKEADDPALSSPSPSVSREGPQTQKQQPPTTQIAPKTNTISSTIPTRMADTTSSTWYLQTESLTNLLDRIDNAFHSPLPTIPSDSHQLHPNNHRTPLETHTPRTPPTKAFLSRLKLASTSIDHLVDLLDEWHALLNGVYCGRGVDGVGQGIGGTNNLISVDGESAFGVYLRKLCLGLEELPFEGLSRLWTGLRQYVDEAEVDAEVEEDEEGENFKVGEECHRREETKTEGEGEGDVATLPSIGNEWMPSSQQVERIVRNTCLLPDLESKLRRSSSSRHWQGIVPCYSHEGDAATNNTEMTSFATSSPQRHCYNLQQTHPECPSIHFLDFLSSLANGQRSRALESLHRYFDYAMIHERKERAERAMMMLQSAGGGGNAGRGDALSGITGMGGPTASAGSGTTALDRMAGQRGGASSPGKFQDSNVMQYAAILLAQMYHRFGYSRLSLQATEEAMRVAQQSGDEECVSFAMGWLALVSSSATASSVGGGGGAGYIEAGSISGRSRSIYAVLGGLPIGGHGMSSRLFRPVAYASMNCGMRMNANEHEALLRRCQRRAADRGLSSLTAGVSLELARQTTYRRYAGGQENEEIDEDGTFGSSSMAWRNIQIAGRTLAPGSSSAGLGASGIQSRGLLGVSAAGGGAAVAGGSIANPLEGGEAPSDIITMNGSETLSILGKRIMMTSGLWDSTGHTSLASLSSCAALYGYGSTLGEEESSLATRRMLTSYFYGPGMEVWRIGGADIDSKAMKSDDSSNNVYATTLLHLAKSSDTKQIPSTGWIQTSSTILHEWCVRSYDFSMARSLQCLLNNHAALPSGALMPAIESSLASLTRSTHLSIQQRDYERAKTSARRACWLASHHGLLFHQAWQLLQLAFIDLESSSCAPQSTIERAIPPLLECLSLCEDYFMDPLRAVALSALAKVHLGMGRFWKARSMLNAAMPLVMQHGHLWLQSDACLTLAKCHLAEATWIEGGKPGDVISGRKGIRSTKDSGQDVDIMNLRQTALSQLEKSASILEQLDDISRLREVYYLQARVYQSLPHSNSNLSKRDEAARKFAQLGIEKQRRMSSKVMSIPRFSTDSTDSGWWDVIQGVLPTDCDDLRRVVLLKGRRRQQT